MEEPYFENGPDLASFLSDRQNEGKTARASLKTSRLVLARVTDGIYREPASSFRELIANAWDADATEITILTDAPRFSNIYVRDNGQGMSYQALAYLVHNIGGSAKRRPKGKELGISGDDQNRTLKGRFLIGKIGIGLFSVSQLARRFRIVTKAPKTNYRLIAEVRLRTYSEDESENALRDDDDEFVTGDISIVREPTSEFDSHGTDIILEDIKPRVRGLLQSAERWKAIDEMTNAADSDVNPKDSNIKEPAFHIGFIDQKSVKRDGVATLSRPSRLPWSADDAPDTRISKLMNAVESLSTTTDRPSLDAVLDTYLATLWKVSLAAPIRYVDRHPFDLTGADNVKAYWLVNETRTPAIELELSSGLSVREAARLQVPGAPILTDGLKSEVNDFRVVIDGIELLRPVRFKFLRTSPKGLESALIFVGKHSPDLTKVDSAARGGELSLESYLYWNGRIVPKENNGVLIRIHGTSGTPFDATFFDYPVLELTRLRQITSEIFIQSGLDAALNIDRESYNFSHPHLQLVVIWLHRALRQVTNRQKRLAGDALESRKVQRSEQARAHVDELAENIWRERRGNDPLPSFSFDLSFHDDRRADGVITLAHDNMPALASRTRSREDQEARAKAVLSVLAAFHVTDDMPFRDQEALVNAILEVFEEQ